jgi:peptidoglycan/xylan/chitin deacetylase (PgdA/CDA1 family)
VVCDDRADRRLARPVHAPSKRLRIDRLVDQYVDAACMADEVLRDARIAGQHHRPAAIVDAVAVRRPYHAVIDEERGHGHAAFGEHHAVRHDVVAHHHDAGRREALVDVAAHVDVEVECLQQVVHHRARARRPPDGERHDTPPSGPSREQQVGKLDDVVRMQVGEEDSRDRADRHAGLREPKRRPSAAVEQEALPPCLDESARAVLLEVDHWARAGTEQDDLEAVGGRCTQCGRSRHPLRERDPRSDAADGRGEWGERRRSKQCRGGEQVLSGHRSSLRCMVSKALTRDLSRDRAK